MAKAKKEKMDPVKKAKLVYSGEFLLIAIVFIVLIILKFTDVLRSDNFIKSTIFNFVTLVGGLLIIGDFIWATLSKKRRSRTCYLDKCIHLPIGIYLLTYDIISLVNWNANYYLGIEAYSWFKYGVIIVFIYIAIDYTFEGIYHYFYPIPEFLRLEAEVRKEQEEERLEKEAKEKEALEANNSSKEEKEKENND